MENNRDKDIYDIQDYVLHHVKYKGIDQLQIIMDWMSFDNVNEDCFVRWIQNNYTEGCDIQELCENCILVVEEHLYKTLGAGTQEVFFEDFEDDALEGRWSVWDSDRISKGQRPCWAKSVKTNEPGLRKPAGSSDHSETAMRKVTDPAGKKEPYRETQWRLDNKDREALNEMVSKKLSELLKGKYKITFNKDRVSVFTGKYDFRIESLTRNYKIMRFNPSNILDKKFETCESLMDVVEYIEKNN